MMGANWASEKFHKESARHRQVMPGIVESLLSQGMSLNGIAREIGIDPATVHRIRHGQSGGRDDIRNAILALYHQSVGGHVHHINGWQL